MGKPQPQEPHGFTGRIFGWLMERLNAASYRAAAQRLPEGPVRLLEIGFGTGAMAELLARRGAALVAGVDPSPLMVGTARRRTRGLPVDLRQGDAASLPWDDASFDAAVALHSFQFWNPVQTCLGELRRVLKPGGRLLLVLRRHGAGVDRNRLPNPLSREADEPGAAVRALGAAGFARARMDGKTGSSAMVIAEKPV